MSWNQWKEYLEGQSSWDQLDVVVSGSRWDTWKLVEVNAAPWFFPGSAEGSFHGIFLWKLPRKLKIQQEVQAFHRFHGSFHGSFHRFHGRFHRLGQLISLHVEASTEAKQAPGSFRGSGARSNGSSGTLK